MLHTRRAVFDGRIGKLVKQIRRKEDGLEFEI